MKENKKTIIISVSTLAIGLLLGWLIFGGSQEIRTDEEHQHISTAEVWSCSMHPQVRQSEPGNCPICGMDLIPLDQYEVLDPMAVSMSPTAMQLADIRTAIVETMEPVKSVRLSGKVQEDERLVFSQSSHLPGRIEKLMVNFTGEYVRKGQPIAYIYAPDLVTAQEELFEAQKIEETQPQLFNSAKEKLKNWKLTDNQIEQILKGGTPKGEFAVQADVSGYVTEKMVNLGDYIRKGEVIYEIADLSKVWVQFDVYESDIAWINKGDKVSFTVASLPGEQFEGKIAFLDPVIDPKSRVAKARVEVLNRGLTLKPEMFVSGTVEARLSKMSNNIVVPKTAVMWTGKRSVVYVKSTATSGVSFRMREVVLGPALGDSFVIASGLKPGEEIAVNGTFSIDAAAQLAGKPSMMNKEGGPAMTGHDHGSSGAMKMGNMQVSDKKTLISEAAKKSLTSLFNHYISMKTALVSDDFDQAVEAGKAINSFSDKIDMNLFKGEAQTLWNNQSAELKASLQHIDHIEDIKALRDSFIGISNAMIAIIESFDPISTTVYIQHCPMADSNNGADWLSRKKEILNPYFGSAMPSCGETTKTIK